MTAQLFERWPDRVTEVLAYDEARAWLLIADAGVPLSEFANPPEAWLRVLPRYAELQRDEVSHLTDHLAHGVPDLRLATLPQRYEELVRSELPLQKDELAELQRFSDRFATLCEELAQHRVADTVQHDDLHARNVYWYDHQWRVLDWGDASISHPFISLVVTFRFLQEGHDLAPSDPWFRWLRDAYLEPWGVGLTDAFTLAMRIGAFTHPLVELRHRSALPPNDQHYFDQTLRVWFDRALAQTRR